MRTRSLEDYLKQCARLVVEGGPEFIPYMEFVQREIDAERENELALARAREILGQTSDAKAQ